MKYIISFKLDRLSYKERTKRFMESGGLPPAGVTMHGRWHAISGSEGFVLASSEDPKAVAHWLMDWLDLIDFQVIPVLDDEELSSVLKARES